jgi:hypothetical protein
MTKGRLYGFVLAACLFGFVYLYFSTNGSGTLCPFRNITGIPCPSCGTTRAIRLILNGEFLSALRMNPFGFIVLPLMTLLPAWIITDLVLAKNSFCDAYHAAERRLKVRWLAITLVLLVLLNWIWNISKGL